MEAEVPVLRSLLCNRQGYKTGQNKTKNVRPRVSFMFGCIAKVTIRLVHGVVYKIVTFEERHTQELVAEKDKQFMRSRRKLHFEHKKFVMDCEKASIGPVRSHRYSLVFILFTGLDHQKSSVMFGASLIFKEDSESYIWLLEKFNEAMVHHPKVILTDRDPSMKSAIKQVFQNSRHRLYIWYIMKKVHAKTKYDTAMGEAFRTKLNKIIWSHTLEPTDFEAQWTSLLDEFPLVKRRWFDEMFSIRQFWIPSYFKDVMFGGLLRTTTVSESANNFYGNFTDSGACYALDIGLDTQRHKHAKLKYESSTMLPDLTTPWSMERHASEVYTLSTFSVVKEQIIEACTSCCMVNMSDENGIKTYGVRDDYAECVAIEEREALMNQLISDIYSYVGLWEDKPDMMKAFSLQMMQKKESLLSECGDSATSSMSIQQNLEKYYGVEVPSEVHILPPEQAKNKGSGSRIPSGREVSMATSRSGQRRCDVDVSSDSFN
ncbi:hypothetical protein V2J09_018549 [Rumex salicifolius]